MDRVVERRRRGDCGPRGARRSRPRSRGRGQGRRAPASGRAARSSAPATPIPWPWMGRVPASGRPRATRSSDLVGGRLDRAGALSVEVAVSRLSRATDVEATNVESPTGFRRSGSREVVAAERS